ncbi:G-type lectin S-receptor-like serine/threonine-protein kinase [Vitis vinifera]|uniref:G-type lectin S-receptor-like serine/threonine-protein kinase n=1 Tax=Vitis vinifera TaxID=29760 RepID=A0A438BPN8_VITVI|nr:G-type lectin S-receptor-like serine/threonine-protein kinase [Vitis vinifera]
MGRPSFQLVGNFELGFVHLGTSKNQYLGIWYKKVTPRTVVWVANRELPVTDSSGVLKVTDQGSLVILNGSNGLIWSSNSSRSARNPTAQLLDSGNLVIKSGNDSDPDNFLWQSFDYPGDTLLPGMKHGRNTVTGLDRYLSSWKSNDDPSKGDFTYGLDPSGCPQLFLRSGSTVIFRSGPWNAFDMDGRTKSWNVYSTAYKDDCDSYALCGAYSTCNIHRSPRCGCMKGFVPKFPYQWDTMDWSNGCVRKTSLDCQKGDGFAKCSGVKLPDTRNSWFNESMNLKECASLCLRNCSCSAYTIQISKEEEVDACSGLVID